MFELMLTVLMGVAQSLSRLGSDALMHWVMKNLVLRRARQRALAATVETALTELAASQGESSPADRAALQRTLKVFCARPGVAQMLLTAALQNRSLDMAMLNQQLDLVPGASALRHAGLELDAPLERYRVVLRETLREEAGQPGSLVSNFVMTQQMDAFSAEQRELRRLLEQLMQERSAPAAAQVVPMPVPLPTPAAAPLRDVPLDRPERGRYFTGRTSELDWLLGALQPGAVVTLCGPGGMGKSALAAEAVWRLAPDDRLPDRFPDGILTYSFEEHAGIDLALQYIATRLGESDLRPTPLAAARRALAGRRLLLVLDGAENTDDLPAVLNVRDRAAVLVTTRRHSQAEGDYLDLTPLTPTDALALLAAWSGPRAGSSADAARLCSLVGYLPLAVRLAGRYLAYRSVTAAEYAEELEQSGLAPLELDRRRLDSVPLLLEKSVAQVSEAARRVLGAVGLLAVAPFPRGAVAAALDISPASATHALGELVDFGLVLRPGIDYVVSHALVHTYARQALVPGGDAAARLALHLADQAATLHDRSALDDLRPHVLAALQAAADQAAWREVDRLASSVKDALELHGCWVDLLAVSELGLQAGRGTGEPEREALWLAEVGAAHARLGRVEQGLPYYEQALALHRALGDRRGEESCLSRLGVAYGRLGQVERAGEYLEQALAIAQAIGDRPGEAQQWSSLANLYFDMGRLDCVQTYLAQALALARANGDRRNEAFCLSVLGIAYTKAGDLDAAVEPLQQALALSLEIGDRHGESNALGNLGVLYRRMGQPQQSVEYYSRALEITRAMGDRRGEGTDLSNLGNAYCDLGLYPQAVTYHEEALAVAYEIRDRRAEANRLGNLGRSLALAGSYDRGLALCQEAVTLRHAMGDRGGEGEALDDLAAARLAVGDAQGAVEAGSQATAILREMGFRQPLARALIGLGDAYLAAGDPAQAEAALEEGLALARAVRDSLAEALALEGLARMRQGQGNVSAAQET